MRIRQGAWVWAVVGLIAAAVAGCTGDTTNVATPTASRSSHDPSATASSPSPTAAQHTPTLPSPSAAMAQPSVDGAVAAAHYFLELYSYSMATGDLDAWRAMSADDCKMCNNVIGQVEDLVAIGHTVFSDPLESPIANGMEVVPSELYGADLDVTQGAWKEIDGAGNVVDSGPPSAAYMQFTIGWGPDGWIVRQVDVHEPRATQ